MGIIYALRESEKLTAKDLALKFEVSERTIYRDIDALSQLRVPIISYEGLGGGYKIDKSYFIPSVSLKRNEVLYLLICLKIGEIIQVPNLKKDYESLKYKLLNILDRRAKEEYMKILERVKFYINDIIPSEYKQDITKKIIQSFCQFKNVMIEYYTPKREEWIERKVTPYRLVFGEGGWYIEGYCHLRNAKRLFRLDRIKSFEITEDTYSPTVVEEHLSSCEKKNDTKKIVLEMEKGLYEAVKRDSIFIDADKRTTSNKVKITISTERMDNILDFAFRNFNDVKILEPKECIDVLKERCKKILIKY